MVEIKAADSEVRCFFTWRMKGHNRFYGSVWKTPMGLEGSGAFRRPGSIVRVLRTERWVRPTERAGSEGSFICCLGQRKPYNRPAGVGKQANLAPLEEMHSPLWWLAPPPSPHFVVGLWMLNHGAKSLQESMEQFILSPGWGESPAQPDKGEPRSG